MSYKHRYFFCLQPPVIERRQIGLLRDEFHHSHGIVADDRLHMTLGITPDFPQHSPDVAAELVALGALVTAEPFRLSLDRLCAGHTILTLRPGRVPSGLKFLQRQVDLPLIKTGFRRTDWSFNPHVTLGYGPRQPFVRPVQPFAWDVAELVLIHSVVKATQHIELGRWPLVQRQLSFAA